MRREIFLREDLAAMLAAIVVAADVPSRARSPHDAAFRSGFATALAAVATSAHISLAEIFTRLPSGERQIFLARFGE